MPIPIVPRKAPPAHCPEHGWRITRRRCCRTALALADARRRRDETTEAERTRRARLCDLVNGRDGDGNV